MAARPARFRVYVTKTVSKIGTRRISIGTRATCDGRSSAGAIMRPTPARKEPRKKLPLSPMKIDAGGRLWSRKPAVAPTNAASGRSRRRPPWRTSAGCSERAPPLEHQREVAGTGNSGDTRGQPVHVVEQVERVRDADNPGEGEELVDDDGTCDIRRCHDEEQDARHKHLDDELHRRPDADEIVHRAERGHQAGTNGKRNERTPFVEHDEAGGGSADDGKAAEQRDRLVAMPAVTQRYCVTPGLHGEEADGRSQGRRDSRPDAQ